MAKNIIKTVKGAREFYPEAMMVRNYLHEKVKKASGDFGYQEYDGPFLETIELYAAKSGEELVKEQSFVFEDRAGDLITLRPELTPSLARMIAQKQHQLTYPLRWWSFGPFWRYERPQKGRSREFFQWNVDMLGVESPEADAELIAVAVSFLRSVGLTPAAAKIFVNNRRLMDSQFDQMGIQPDRRSEVSNLVDRRSKMSPQNWDQYALEIGLSPQQLTDLKKLLDNQNLWQASEEMVRLFHALKALDVDEFVQFDPNIMRGLLYYTGTVFEAFDLTGGVRRAILGGGRYDNLLADVGGDPLSGVGFAMGDVVIGIILDEKGLLPLFQPSPTDVLVTVFDDGLWSEALQLSAELRQAGLAVTCYPEPVKLGKQFKFAAAMQIRIALVLGPDEAASLRVAVKDLKTGEQQVVNREKTADFVKKILAS